MLYNCGAICQPTQGNSLDLYIVVGFHEIDLEQIVLLYLSLRLLLSQQMSPYQTFWLLCLPCNSKSSWRIRICYSASNDCVLFFTSYTIL